MFHHAVAQLLLTCIWFMKDTQAKITFLTTQVHKLGDDEWNKLLRLIGYLKQKIMFPLIMWDDGVNVLKLWVDVSYAAHDNIRGHTGGKI